MRDVLRVIEIPELSHFGAAVRVPELRDVRLTGRVRAVIDHPDFQRLRRVRQLGPTHLVYPGAVHTRFEHSLGAYGYAQRFVVSLLRHPAVAGSVSERDVLTVLAAALCHDIGHYPFAHSLEALHRRGRETPRHEDLAARVLEGSLGSLLSREWGVDPARVTRLFRGKRAEQQGRVDRILSSIISSAIDADKMDYLERDSAHLGVPYGRSFDAGRLVASLTLNEAEDALAVDAKGKISAEQFVFSRYMMFSEAYWHHAVRAASAMVEAALADHVARRDPAELTTLLLSMGDDELLATVHSEAPAGSVADRLLGGITGDRRALHKRIATYSRAYAEPEKRAAYERLYAMDGEALDAVTWQMSAALASLTGHRVFPGDVLVDTPPRDKDHPETVDVRYAGVRGRTSYPLHELSRIVAGVHADFVQVVKKIRVFVAPTLAAAARARQHEAEEALLSAIGV